MADPKIYIRRSAAPGKVPTDSQLSLGELAVNTRDGKLYLKKDETAVGLGSTVVAVNPWSVGIGTTTYDTFFNSGNVGIGTTNPTTELSIDGVLSYSNNNVRIGDNTTGSSITSGTNNNFVGVGAGSSNTTGNNNNFFGNSAGSSNTTGGNNNFFGIDSGFSNTTGSHNTFFGSSAGQYNTTGSCNTFIGRCAGCSNTEGSNNNFFGGSAGRSNTTGCHNNFFGSCAGFCNTTGCFNTFLGSFTGISTSASNKVILGRGFNSSNHFDSPDTTKDTQFAVGVRTDANPSKYWLVGNENFNIGIGTINPTSKLTVGGDISNNYVTYGSITFSASTLSPVGIHSVLPVATYRSVEYFIQATTGSRYHVSKILSIHDGSTAYNTTYGDVFSNGSIATFDIDISGGNIRLVATASTSTSVKYIINYIANIV